MNEVERHSVTGYGRQDINYNDPEGEFVYYEDYTALQQQLTATTNILKSAGIEADTVQAGVMELVSRMNQVVAENAALKDINAWCKTDAFENMYREFKTAEAIGCPDVDCMHDAMLTAIMHAPETPATEACLNAVRADAVVEAFVTVFDVCSRDDHIDEKLWNYGVLRVEKHADEYVAQLRAGASGAGWVEAGASRTHKRNVGRIL